MGVNNPAGFATAFRLPRSLQLFPQLELTPDLSRGEQRLAGEVAVAKLTGHDAPGFAYERAFDVLLVMARG